MRREDNKKFDIFQDLGYTPTDKHKRDAPIKCVHSKNRPRT